MAPGPQFEDGGSRGDPGVSEHLVPLEHLAAEPIGRERGRLLKGNLPDQFGELGTGDAELAFEPIHGGPGIRTVVRVPKGVLSLGSPRS